MTTKRWALKISTLTAMLGLVLASFAPLTATAAGQCTASVNLPSVAPMSINGFDITVTNTGSSDINWIDITVPPNHFTYSGNSIYGWSTADHNGGTTLTGSTIAPGFDAVFSVTATADILNTPAVAWVISTDDSGGASPVNCGGNATTAIEGQIANDSSSGVSNIAVSDISASAATITWDSDFPATSMVFWGKTSGYGNQSPVNPDLVYNHQVVLTGLDSSTGYHFQVVGSSDQGGFVYSADNTFLTTGPPNPGTNDVPVISVVTPPPKKSTERTPPTVKLNDLKTNVSSAAPALSGEASDNVAVTLVQYSTDGGKNWLPVTQAKGLGSQHATFSFTPPPLKDGTYEIKARAIDTSGNIGVSTGLKIVIARVAPAAGGNMFSLGSQVLNPDAAGVVTLVSGIDQKITLSCVGGPVQVSVEAAKAGQKAAKHIFNLTKSPDTGLWSGIISFDQPGQYQLTANVINGAGVKGSRSINSVNVLDLASIKNKKTNKPVPSLVTLYYYETESKKWVVWDGGAYNQTNPQVTDKNGNFKLFIPPGKYYLQVEAPGYQTIVSRIVEFKQTTPLTAALQLNPLYELKLGAWHMYTLPNLTAQYVNIAPAAAGSDQKLSTSNLVGKQLPNFKLTATDGGVVNSINLLGRPTVITFGATWSPATDEQAATLAGLQSNQNINVVPIALQEDASKVRAHTAIAGLDLKWLVDPDSTLSTTYNVQSLPMHYFMDRRGEVKQVTSGVLSEQQILNILKGL